jgi:hypothetical protein
VPLDDLVGAPEVGDPRIRLKPRRANGRTVIPLTRQPGGTQAWKIVIPISKVEPVLKAHEGYEWLYVLSGRMRLVLGDHDLVLGPGEVAEFDTRVPHWFGSTGRQARGGPEPLRAAGRAAPCSGEVPSGASRRTLSAPCVVGTAAPRLEGVAI